MLIMMMGQWAQGYSRFDARKRTWQCCCQVPCKLRGNIITAARDCAEGRDEIGFFWTI